MGWHLSTSMINRLRGRILQTGSPADGWSDMTREYQHIASLMDCLWRQTRFGITVTFALAYHLASAFLAVVLVIADRNGLGLYLSWYVALRQSIFLCVFLYLMASISSKCRSSKHSRQSLLFV